MKKFENSLLGICSLSDETRSVRWPVLAFKLVVDMAKIVKKSMGILLAVKIPSVVKDRVANGFRCVTHLVVGAPFFFDENLSTRPVEVPIT